MSVGRELLQALKTTAPANGPCLSIPVGSPVEATLRPVATTAGNLNDNDVRLLTEWRNRFVKSFLTQFEATDARTAKWLTETVGPDPGRVLFMLDDARGKTVGHLGLAFIDWELRAGEADAIVRGASAAPGVMTKALFTLFDWAREQLQLQHLSARVRSDNPALSFFLKFATENRRVPLRRVDEPGMIRWVEDASLAAAETALVYIAFPSQRNPL
jgi:RimJ/RimL family protein N-acetyltransferase